MTEVEEKQVEAMKALMQNVAYEEICIALVRENPSTLQYIQEQTPEICLEAVKQDAHLLKYVKEQTPEICLEAIISQVIARDVADNLRSVHFNRETVNI